MWVVILPLTQPSLHCQSFKEEEIERVLTACLHTHEQLRNFAIMMVFLDTGLRLDELVNMRFSQVDFAVGEMTIFGKGSKKRKVLIGAQAKKAVIDYITKERPEPTTPKQHLFGRLSPNAFKKSMTKADKMVAYSLGKVGLLLPLARVRS